MKDFEGREIKVGDVIVYAVRHGSWMGFTRGHVTSVGVRHAWGREDEFLRVKPIRQRNSFSSDKLVTLTSPTCVVMS